MLTIKNVLQLIFVCIDSPEIIYKKYKLVFEVYYSILSSIWNS